MAVENIQKNAMMAHLLKALEAGHDIGHYGRLVFAMVARHFLLEDELVISLQRIHTSVHRRRRAYTTRCMGGTIIRRGGNASRSGRCSRTFRFVRLLRTPALVMYTKSLSQ